MMQGELVLQNIENSINLRSIVISDCEQICGQKANSKYRCAGGWRFYSDRQPSYARGRADI